MDQDPEQSVDQTSPITAHVQPSFKGRLQLHDFMYQNPSTKSNPTFKSPSPIRRSARHLNVTPSSSSTNMAGTPIKSEFSDVETSSSWSRKRKRPTIDAVDSVDAVEADLSDSWVILEEDDWKDDKEEAAAALALYYGTRMVPNSKKRVRGPNAYAPPEVYAHLRPLPDILAPNLLVLFIGLNPGIQTSHTGHAYAHPSNLFWKLLHWSGLTPVRCQPEEDRTLPERFGLGNTNIVSRPSRNGAELSKAEMDDGVAVLEAKIREYRPEVACIVGKGIWESVWRKRHGRNLRKSDNFAYGWQHESENMGVVKPTISEEGVEEEDGFKGARVFVATTTSGLAAGMRPSEKEAIWRELGDWCMARRQEKELKAEQAESSS
ncbi:DNA glycosylase [Apiospora marii]|uniref:DNA glycosylase n=1 Tax=Apiospora marii TaxID=335849 RepID=A0ABR1REP7_9PEZI